MCLFTLAAVFEAMASNILPSVHHSLLAVSMLLTFTTSSVISVSTAHSDKATLGNEYRGTNSNQSKILAVFVFGDSTVDPGNNNYILTDFKSDFPPYGRDFVRSQPTGRFTNGRLVTDFIASYVGVKDYIPPFLDPTLSVSELKTGVSFASAGTGLDPLTAKLSNVIPIRKQLEYFREYRSKMEKALGKREMDHIIKHSIFVISAGTNDFGIDYLLVPLRRMSYTVSEYQNFLLSQLKQLIQELRKEGAKKIGVVGLPPIGCLPVLITLFSEDRFAGRKCIESFSSIARDYNRMLKNELSSKTYQSEGFIIVYADIYTPLNQIFRYPKQFGQYFFSYIGFLERNIRDSEPHFPGMTGFEEVRKGCCGTGVVETSFLCNPKSRLCSDASKYAFFDSIHPTEKAYRILFESFIPLIDFVIHHF